MTFDEAIKEIDEALDLIDYEDMPNKIYGVFNKLREEYAPTVEMTKVQKDTIISLLDNSDISKDDWDTMITDDSPELPEISYRQAILAYMNPETIKTVDK